MLGSNLTSLRGLLSDEELDTIERNAGLERALALMAASGPSTSPTSFASVLQQGLQQGRQAEQAGLQSALQTRQLKQSAQKEQGRKQVLGMLRPDSSAALEQGGGPTVANAAKIGNAPTKERYLQAINAAIYDLNDLEFADQLKKQMDSLFPAAKYEKLGKGEKLLNPMTGEVVAQGAEDLPSTVREYQFAVQQGYPGTFRDFQIEGKKAGATNVNVPVYTGKQFSETLAKSVAENAFADVQNASNAINTITTVNNMEAAIDKAVIGTAANSRLALLRLGQTLGVSGKDDSERLAATSQLIQGLAQTQLNVAQSNKGQGTFTDFERKLLAQAASGDTQMSGPELKSLMKAMKKSATLQYNSGKRAIDAMRKDPNLTPISPYLNIPEMPKTGNLRYNPNTGNFE